MSSVPRFQGSAWLLLEPKTTFFSPRYRPESLSVRTEILPFWGEPQVVLQLGQFEYLVLKFSPDNACKYSKDPKETKKVLQVTVRPLDDVKRAQLYQTAARTQVLEVFVDGEETREHLLCCLRGEKISGKKLLDDAFLALEKAQQSKEIETSIGLYKEAENGFWEAEKVLQDDRSRELLCVRRKDLQRTIRRLEDEKFGQNVDAACAIVPPKDPQPVLPKTIPGTKDINARLAELRRFTADQDDAVHENRMDLAGRLAALKNEKAGSAVPLDALVERFRRLRGDKEPIEATYVVETNHLEEVDRVIEQVTDELALGIIHVDEDTTGDVVIG